MSFKTSERPELQLGNQTQQGFCSFVKSLPETDGKTIRLFERDNESYYSVHGEDAYYVARRVYKTITVLKYLGGSGGQDKGLASCTLSRMNTEIFLKHALLEDQMRIEIWANVEPRKTPLWAVKKKASPGNLQQVEDMIFANTDSATTSVIMSTWLTVKNDQKILGVAFVDTSMREFGVTEFIENDTYSNLESITIQHQIKECLVLQNENQTDLDLNNMIAVLERCNIMVTPCKRKLFNSSNVEQDLNRLLIGDISVSATPEFELKNAMISISSIIQYLNLLGDDSNEGVFSLKQYNLNQYMKLDLSAVRALNLTPSLQNGANKTMSLQGLLDRCKTAQGSRLLAQWIKQPLLDVDLITQRQCLVKLFFNNYELSQNLQNSYLKAVPDLARLSRKFIKSTANLQDVVRVYQLIIKLPGIYDSLKSADSEYADIVSKIFTDPLEEHIKNTSQFQEMVESTIDLELVDSHQFVIKPDFDDELQRLRAEMNDAMNLMITEQNRVADAINMEAEKKLKLEKSAMYGYCFRLSRNASDASCIRNKQALYPELTTQKNGVYFTTKALRLQSQRFHDCSDKYSKSQSSLVAEILKISASYASALIDLGNTLAHLDVLVSFAVVSMTSPTPYVCPEINMTKRSMVLKGSRHPCLEVQDDVHFIANDVSMVRGESEFLIITGPNMGGKSTYIRQIGMIALMTQIGCFVPCDYAELCIFDSILARVGAGDALIKGISTFMAEMLETASILKTATNNSLIIIDELGRGTSTYDGFGLAWAISEHIINQIGSFCLFATHFHELTSLAKDYSTVENLQVLANTDNPENNSYDITLLYKIEKGICDQSFGIHVAQLAKFPKSVLNLAKQRVEELEKFNFGSQQNNVANTTGKSDNAIEFKKEEIEEGSKIIESFLIEFSQIKKLEELNGAQVASQVEILRQKYRGQIEQNRYVQHVINSF